MTLASSSLPLVVFALALLAGWGAAALVLSAWHRAIARRPALGRYTVVAAALPWLVGVAAAVGAWLPGDPHTGRLLACHCLESMPAWLHLCPAHPEESRPLVVPALATLALLAPGRLRALRDLAREPLGAGGGGQPRVVSLGRPAALLHGWLRPTLVVDQALWRSLSQAERSALLAHERGHLLRRDPLLLMVLRVLLVIAPAAVAARAARAWLDRAELCADREAARLTGDPGLVAATLVRCARLYTAAPSQGLAWTGGALERRVHALLAPPQAAVPARPDLGLADLLLLLLLTGLGVASRPWVHHQLEHLLNLSL